MRFQALRVPKLASLESLFDILAVLSFHSWICFARRRPPWRCCGLGLRRRLSKSAPGGFPYPNLSRDASKPANETRSQFPALSYSPSWHTTVRNLMAPLRPTSLEVPKQAIWPILYGHTGTAFRLVVHWGCCCIDFSLDCLHQAHGESCQPPRAHHTFASWTKSSHIL